MANHRLRRGSVLLALTLAISGIARAQATLSPYDSVDPLIGTDEHGHVFPGATTPLGMIQASPDTREGGWDGASGYHYSDGRIIAFSHTHLSGTGCTDLGDIRIMPTVGDVTLEPGDKDHPVGYASTFKHANEHAAPGIYSVALDSGVKVDVTATPRAALYRYTFPQNGAAHVVVDLRHGVGPDSKEQTFTIENDHTVTGFRKTDGWGGERTIFFAVEFSKPFTGSGIQLEGKDSTDKTAHGKDVRAHLDFSPDGQPVYARVAISTVSVQGAKANLAGEIKDFNFDTVANAAKQAWSDALGRLEVADSDKAARRTFYTALYHTLVAPTLLSDIDGQYRGPDGKVHKADFNYFTQLSLWDTYRAENPLLTFTQPQHVNDFVRTFLAHADAMDRHTLPVWVNLGKENWCMIGDHAIPIITEAYNKGFRDWDAHKALASMITSVENNMFEKDRYRAHGYIPHDPQHDRQTVSKTLEYAYDDSCIARLAQALGDEEAAKKYGERATWWKNVLDPETKLMRGKNADGSWLTPFDPTKIDFHDYTEANAWQYSFYVPQDVPGMMNGMGGPDGFVKQLDTMFDTDQKIPNQLSDVTGVIGMYAHGNEPCHHVAYLYDYAGRPDQTAKRVRAIASTLYNDSPAGLCGNDDCGQTSAWYVFSALGFYPVDPASATYQIGSPLFNEVSLHVTGPDGGAAKTFKVVAADNSPTNIYIQNATLNGQPLNTSTITYQQIAAGGELRLQMGPKPSTWAHEIPTTQPNGTADAR